MTDFIPLAAPDYTPAEPAPAATPTTLHHTMAFLLRALLGRRQGLSIATLEAELHLRRKNVGHLIRQLRAYGAVEPLAGNITDYEQRWAITAHGAWMLAEGVACAAAYRPAPDAPDIVPARTWLNSSMRSTYTAPAPSPVRAGVLIAYALPSHGACGVRA